MSTWTNKSTAGTTSWGAESGIVSAWDTRDETDNLTTQIGAVEYAAGVSGTYNSAPNVSSSIIGSKYHLLDNREFSFGTDKDFNLKYDQSLNSLLVSVGVTNAMVLTTDGDLSIGTLELTPASSLDSPNSEGQIKFYNSKLYIGV